MSKENRFLGTQLEKSFVSSILAPIGFMPLEKDCKKSNALWEEVSKGQEVSYVRPEKRKGSEGYSIFKSDGFLPQDESKGAEFRVGDCARDGVLTNVKVHTTSSLTVTKSVVGEDVFAYVNVTSSPKSEKIEIANGIGACEAAHLLQHGSLNVFELFIVDAKMFGVTLRRGETLYLGYSVNYSETRKSKSSHGRGSLPHNILAVKGESGRELTDSERETISSMMSMRMGESLTRKGATSGKNLGLILKAKPITAELLESDSVVFDVEPRLYIRNHRKDTWSNVDTDIEIVLT